VSGWAATYTANGAGLTGSSSTIGTVGFEDYPSLFLAAADYNSIPGGMAGNYTFYINSNLTEPANLGFGAPTNGFTLTFKPSLSVIPTITFTSTFDNVGPSGGWIIGTPNLAISDDTKLMPNVIIDGSNTPGGVTRDLTLTCATNFSRDLTVPGDAGGYPVLIKFHGLCDFAVVKNTNIIMSLTDPLYLQTRSYYALSFISRRNAVTLTNDVPDGWTVMNCSIQAVGSRQQHGLCATNSGTITPAVAQTGVLISHNEIIGQTRGVLLNQNADFIVENNMLGCQQNDPLGALVSTGFVHASSNAATPWTAIIRNNYFNQNFTAATVAGGGLAGMQISGAPFATGTQYQIYNNMICNFTFTNPAPFDGVYQGIVNASSYSDLKIYHNSIDMPEKSNVTGATIARVHAIVQTSANVNNNFDAKENIIRFLPLGVNAFVYRKANVTVPICNYNDIWNNPAVNGIGSLAAVNYATWALWQGAGYDLNSVQFDPTVPSLPGAGIWVSPIDLHFTTDPGPMYNCINVGILDDIDGEARLLSNPLMGCDEVPHPGVGDWMIY